MAINLETKTARLRLEVRGKPYWLRLSGGISLGYRRIAGAGSWSVRLSDGQRGNSIKRIAIADDAETADGKTIMSFAEARDAALHLGRGEVVEEKPAPIGTLSDAIDAYRADLVARGGRVANAVWLTFNLTPAMLKRPVALLDVTELRKWRDAATKRMVPSSVNRLLKVMKAVLNLAAVSDRRLDSRVWQVGLTSLPEATVPNNVVLPESVIRRLVEAAHEQSSEFGLLVETLAATGARVSQIARCEVRDLVGERLMIPSSAKGQKKRMTRVPVPIPASLADQLRIPAARRSLTEPLLPKPSGMPWIGADHSLRFARAVKAIGEDPAAITSYALRHSHITAQLLAGLPVQLVAKLHDTSASQIERHYAAEIANHTDHLVRGAMTDFGAQKTGVVVPLRA